MLGIRINYENRIFGFDLLRAFAIFLVVHGHGKHYLHGTLLEGFPWIPTPRGIDIFFVLSGFLIGNGFMVAAMKTGDLFRPEKSLNFWKRAIVRILPNYYLILLVNYFLVNAGILPGSTHEFSIWRFATFTQNLAYPFYDFFWESWSLATQVWYYLLFPLLLALLGTRVKMKYLVPVISAVFILISVLYRLHLNGGEYDAFWWDVTFRKVALSRFDCIFIGVLAAWVRCYHRKFWERSAWPAFVLGLALFAVAALAAWPLNSFVRNVVFLSLGPVYISLLFPLIDRWKDTRSLAGRLITLVSFLSYAMYLFNLMLAQILDRHFPDLLTSHTSLKYLLYWVVTLLLSYLLYVLYEHPIAEHGYRWFHTTKVMYKRMDS